MKIGFNEGCNRFCKDHSVLKDLDLCEKYGFDYIDVQSECLNRDLEAGKYTIEELGEWFKTHKLKMLSYNALIFFNMKQTQAEKDAVMAELDEIIRRCNILGCKMIVVVPSMDLPVHATVGEIKADAVAVLKEMVKKVEPHGIRLSLEFCGAPTMSINRFEYAYDIVKAVDSPFVGITLDQYHFHAMASQWETLEQADGKYIFVWHLTAWRICPAARTTTTTRSVCGRASRAIAWITSATPIRSRRSASPATYAPWKCSAPPTTSSLRKRTSRRRPRSPAHTLRNTADTLFSFSFFFFP